MTSWFGFDTISVLSMASDESEGPISVSKSLDDCKSAEEAEKGRAVLSKHRIGLTSLINIAFSRLNRQWAFPGAPIHICFIELDEEATVSFILQERRRAAIVQAHLNATDTRISLGACFRDAVRFLLTVPGERQTTDEIWLDPTQQAHNPHSDHV